MCHLYAEQSIVGTDVGAMVGFLVVGASVGRLVGFPVFGVIVGTSVGGGGPVGDGVVRHSPKSIQGMEPQQSCADLKFSVHLPIFPPQGFDPSQLCTHFPIARSTYHGTSCEGRDVGFGVFGLLIGFSVCGAGVVGAIVGRPSGQIFTKSHLSPEKNASQHFSALPNKKLSLFPGDIHSFGKFESFVHVFTAFRSFDTCQRALHVVPDEAYNGNVGVVEGE